MLSFDDVENLESWQEHIGLIESHGAVATFYIDRPASLASEQLDWLGVIQDMGHEVGFHGTNHVNAVQAVYFDDMSLDEYVDTEILPGLDILAEAGLAVSSFAYPYGHHSEEIDNALLPYFHSLRGVAPFVSWAYHRLDDSAFFRGISLYVHADI